MQPSHPSAAPARITQIMLAKGFGGAERLFVDLCHALASQGTQVQAIFHPDFEHRDALHGHAGIEPAPVRVRAAWDPLAVRDIRRRLAAFRPHAVHTHLARAASVGGRAAQSLRLPVVANLHNYVDLKRYRRVDYFAAGTADQRRYLLDQGIDPTRIEVIPHFSLLPPGTPARWPADTPPVFVSYGRMVRKKGFDILIEAFAKLHAERPGTRLLLGGSGPEEISLRELTHSLGLDAAVQFCGWVQDTAHFLEQGVVFVLPSLDEPFGIVVLEAMARGRTLIATTTQGPREVLDEHAAYLVPPGNVDALHQALRHAVDDTARGEDLARAAHELYMRHYRAEVVIPQFMELYRRAAG